MINKIKMTIPIIKHNPTTETTTAIMIVEFEFDEIFFEILLSDLELVDKVSVFDDVVDVIIEEVGELFVELKEGDVEFRELVVVNKVVVELKEDIVDVAGDVVGDVAGDVVGDVVGDVDIEEVVWVPVVVTKVVDDDDVVTVVVLVEVVVVVKVVVVKVVVVVVGKIIVKPSFPFK